MNAPPFGFAPPAPSLERRRRPIGLALWIVAMAAGLWLNVRFQLLEASARGSGPALGAVLQGALFAFVPLCVYLAVPAVLDRYDPEPWWCLAMVFLWGSVVATGFSGLINATVQ